MELSRSNVKPPTLHKPGVGVDGLKIHVSAMVAEVPDGMFLKLPKEAVTLELFHSVTSVAVAKPFDPLIANVTALEPPVPYVTTPPNLMLPEGIGMA